MNRAPNQRGSILVALLWCVALLSVVVIGVLHTARMDLKIGRNHADRIQARYIALAGVERAKAVLWHNARERSRSRKNHGGEYFDNPGEFRQIPFGKGHFSILRAGKPEEASELVYGVDDEESRLNLNSAGTNELARLELMTPELLAAIQDWRDGDNAVSPAGAETEYYSTLMPPRLPRNGPFQTVRELLMVRGVTAELLFGPDTSGVPETDPAGSAAEPAGRGGRSISSQLPWASMLSLFGRTDDVNAAGEPRVPVQSADEKALTGISGITAEIARAIIAHRGQNEIRTLADLLDVPMQAGPAGGAGRGGPNPGGPKAISEQLLRDIADDISVGAEEGQAGLVNINTAGLDVLACLPGLDRQLAQAIVAHRKSAGYFQNPAWLLQVTGITQDIFKQVAPRVTVRSETYRILSEGVVKGSGTRQRIEAVVHIGLKSVETLGYQEIDL